jgi:hypothetical protein
MHRPFNNNGTPIALLSRQLASFIDDVRAKDEISMRQDLTRQDIYAATSLMAVCSNHYTSEKDLTDRIRKVFNECFDWGMQPYAILRSGVSMTTDGTVFAHAGPNRTAICMALNLEVKLNKGQGGCDPYIQNNAYYFQFWSHCIDENRRVYEHCECPSILVDIEGPDMSIAVAMWAEEVHVDPVTSVSLLHDPYDHARMLLVAHIMRCFRVHVERLQQMYASLNFTNPIIVPQSLEFPYFQDFKYKEDTLRIDYRNKVTYGGPTIQHATSGPGSIAGGSAGASGGLVPKSMDLVFEAECQSGPIIVKFCRTYGTVAHQAAYDMKLAPELLSCEQVQANTHHHHHHHHRTRFHTHTKHTHHHYLHHTRFHTQCLSIVTWSCCCMDVCRY